MSKNFTFWSGMIGRMLNIRVAYDEIKNNPEAKPVSTLLGKKATKYNILFLIMMGLCIATMVGVVEMLTSGGVFIAILLIALAVLFAVMGVGMVILALMCSIYQLRLNKKPTGYVNLIFSILVLVLTIVGVILIALK